LAAGEGGIGIGTGEVGEGSDEIEGWLLSDIKKEF
jgi:hypothetical protein